MTVGEVPNIQRDKNAQLYSRVFCAAPLFRLHSLNYVICVKNHDLILSYQVVHFAGDEQVFDRRYSLF